MEPEMSETTEKSLEMMSPQEVEECKRREDRKRRNRESAAKCRQKLKDKLISSQRVVNLEEYRNKALKNEISLVDIELKKLMVVFKQHTNHCNLPNGYNTYFARNNGIHSFQAITATTSGTDFNNNSNNHKNDN